MKRIDFCTDTNIAPTNEMIEQAFNAKIGDAVYDLDPKTIELEDFAAKKFGKEKAIFLPSGVMGNLVALLTHTQRGNEIILEENAHIKTSETGGAACVGGLMLKTIKNSDGAPKSDEIENAIRSDDQHYPKTALICLENTHYRYGGIVVPLERFRKIRLIADKYNLPIHLDGARLFNAAVYLGINVKNFTKYVDSVMISLSKGLGAPVGSVLCGSENFIKIAKKFRKMLGGGMRKIGWLSACALVALRDKNLETRLKQDHENALLLAERLSTFPEISVNLNRIQTNIVIAKLDRKIPVSSLIQRLAKERIFVVSFKCNRLRFYTSNSITNNDINFTIAKLNSILKDLH